MVIFHSYVSLPEGKLISWLICGSMEMSFVISKGPISSHGPDGPQLLHDSDHCGRQLFGATGHGRPETDQGNTNLEIDVHMFDVKYQSQSTHVYTFSKFC